MANNESQAQNEELSQQSQETNQASSASVESPAKDASSASGSVEQDVTTKVEDAVQSITGVDVSKEIADFVSASKKLLDAIFSGVTAKLEEKINSYVQQFLK